MMQSSGAAPSPIENPKSEVRDPLSPFFFAGFFRLLYWTYFKPSGYYDYILFQLGDNADEADSHSIRRALRNAGVKRFLVKCLFLVAAVTAAAHMAIGLIDLAPLSLQWLVVSVVCGIAASIIFGAAISATFNVASGMVSGVAIGLAFGFVAEHVIRGSGPLISIALFATTVSIAFGVVGGTAGMAVGVLISVVVSAIFGLVYGGVGSALLGLYVAIGFILTALFLRLIFYPFQLVVSLTLRTRDTEAALRRSPAIWDELMILPQPHLAQILHAALVSRTAKGVRECSRVISNPFQRWAVQRALSGWLSTNLDQAYPAFEHLFPHLEPYRSPGFGNGDERRRMRQSDFTTWLILGELGRRSPIPDFTDSLAHAFTFWLRDRKPSRLTSLAAAYYELLKDKVWHRRYLAAFERLRPYKHGEETYQTFRTLDNFLSRTLLEDLSRADAESAWLSEMADPLRPDTLDAISNLAKVSQHVREYRSTTSAVGQRNALINAGLAASVVRKRAGLIKSPERVLIERVAQQWLDIINAEQARLAAPREVRRVRNMYLVGRPVLPDSGHPFVGRRDQFETIERMWVDATLKEPVILHGQRRMGKSSILHHLEKNLGPAYVALYANLQSLAAVDATGAFVYNLCDEIHRRLRRANVEIPTPQPGDFAEPFTGLRRFLNVAEDGLGNGRWLVLMLDEFEMIEEKIKDGAIRPELLYQLRDAMLNRPRLAIVLAGLHTLEEMTRDYWSPFFSGSRNVKVSYLDPDAAETLITNPWDGFELEFDREAVRLVGDVTGRQPTLLQAVCSALIDRVNARLEKEGPQYSPRVSPDDVKAVLNDVQASSTYFDAVWKELGDDERLVLGALAEAQTRWNVTALCAEVEARLRGSLSPDETDRAWDLLKKRDMVIMEGGEAKFYVELVRRWVRSQKPVAELLNVNRRRTGDGTEVTIRSAN